MGRKNKRKRTEYSKRLGFNPKKYINYNDYGCSDYSRSFKRSVGSPYRCRTNRKVHRGDVWFAELGSHPGTSVQSGCRPVLVISNNTGNHFAETFNVVPMSSRMKRTDLPSHIILTEEHMTERDLDRAFEPSVLMLEQVTTIGRSALVNYIGRVTDKDKLAEISKAMSEQLDL